MDLMSLQPLSWVRKSKRGKLSVVEAVKAAIDSIEAKEEKFNCYVTVQEEGAGKSRELQKKLMMEILQDLLRVYQLQSKIICVQKGLLQHVVLRFLKILSQLTQQRQFRILRRLVPLLLERQTWMSLPWEVQQRLLHYGVTKNPWNAEHVPGGSSGGSVQQLQQMNVVLHLVPIQADLSVSQAPSVVLPESNQPMERFPVTD